MSDDEPTEAENVKKYARELGKRGGKKAAANMTAKQRSDRASKAALAKAAKAREAKRKENDADRS